MSINTLNIDQTAEFLKVSVSMAYDLANSGVLPGAKIGAKWVFIETELATYLSNEVANQQRKRAERADHESSTPEPVRPVKIKKQQTKESIPSISELPAIP